MKLATDTWMLRPRSISQVFEVAAEVGYPHVEFAPREDFLPSHRGRRASLESVAEARAASRATGVGIASLFVEYSWASLDENVRSASVRYWRQAIEAATELDCTRINGELSGSPSHPIECEAAFRRSIDEVLPAAEAAGITIALEPHPGDFIENAFRAVDLIRGFRSDSLFYLHCVPHHFYLDGTATEILRYAGRTLDHVHLADTFKPERTFLNPTSPNVRIHQHLDIGLGEIDWPEIYQVLRDIGFDGVLTAVVFRAEDRLIKSLSHNLARVQEGLASAGWDVDQVMKPATRENA